VERDTRNSHHVGCRSIGVLEFSFSFTSYLKVRKVIGTLGTMVTRVRQCQYPGTGVPLTIVRRRALPHHVDNPETTR
jgi:hypothetical protein